MGRAGPAITAAAALVVVLGATGFLLSQERAERPVRAPRTASSESLTPFYQSAGAIAFGRLVRTTPTLDVTRSVSVMLPGSPPRTVLADPACCLSWSPTGSPRVLVTTAPPGQRTREAVIAVNRGLTEVADRRFALGPAVWTRDGELIAAWAADPADPGRNGIYTWRLDGKRLARLTHTRGGRAQRPLAYSPNGKRLLVYEVGPDPRRGILATVPATGGALRQVNPPGTWVRCCRYGAPGTWSPDGSAISFAAFTGGPSDGPAVIEVASAGGRTVQRIGAATWPSGARWSPTGQWIAYDSEDRPGGGFELYLIHPDGTGVRPLRAAPSGVAAGACCPQWSPNGRELVYERGITLDRLRLWILNIDGSGTRPVTGTSSGFTFTWCP